MRQGDAARARGTLASAVVAISAVTGDERPLLSRMVVQVLAEMGDLDTAKRIVEGLLARTYAQDDLLGYAANTVSGATLVAAKLDAAGRHARAVDLLGEVSGAVGGVLGQRMGGEDALAELATAQALLGDRLGADTTVRHADSPTRGWTALAGVAAGLAASGQDDAAMEVAHAIDGPMARARAFGAVAAGLAVHGDPHRSSVRFEQAVDAARQLPPDEAVRTLIEIANAQAKADHIDACRHTLTAARTAAEAVASPNTRDQCLVPIARAQARAGDTAEARYTADRITNPWFSGEALVWVAVASAGQEAGLDGATDIAKTIESPWWRAVWLALVAATKRARGDQDWESHYTKTQLLINKIPEGESRGRLREAIIEVAVAAGDYQLAVTTVEAIKTDRADRALMLAEMLAAKTTLDADKASDAIWSLLPICAMHVTSAYLACRALASVHPDQAAAIVAEIIAADASNTTYDTGQTGEPFTDVLWRGLADEDLDDEDRAPGRWAGQLMSETDSPFAAGYDTGDPEDPLHGADLSDAVEAALLDAAARWTLGDLVDTRVVLESLMRVHVAGDWSRIWLHFRPLEGVQAAIGADPVHQPGGTWGGAILTVTCAQALRMATQLSAAYDLWPMPPGVLALALIADPGSAAAQCVNGQDEVLTVDTCEHSVSASWMRPGIGNSSRSSRKTCSTANLTSWTSSPGHARGDIARFAGVAPEAVDQSGRRACGTVANASTTPTVGRRRHRCRTERVAS